MTDDIAERFQRDTAIHKMTVLRDDGLYRHLRFRRWVTMKDGRRSASSQYWFDLITWPGSLAVNGDCGSFLFARTDDMFEFFRGHRINPDYWAEKVRAQDRTGITTYSEDAFRREVVGYVTDAIRARCAPRGIGRAIREEIFGPNAKWAIYCEEGARETLRDFEFGASFTAECTCGARDEGLTEHEANRWYVGHPLGAGHKTTVKRVDGFTFADADTWEWDLNDYDWQYLWCCHAIVWGIAQYDKRPSSWWHRIVGSLTRKG